MTLPLGTGIILASASPTRRRLLANTGISFATAPANVDETHIKSCLIASPGYPTIVAPALALAKATDVSRNHPSSLIIGVDQTLLFNNQIFDKPRDIPDARAQLLALRGKTHHLQSALACVIGGKVLWTHDTTAELTMQHFTRRELDYYFTAVGDDCLTTVGGYKIEGPAITLFSDIKGDYFTILGLPLLPLIGFLRDAQLLPGIAP